MLSFFGQLFAGGDEKRLRRDKVKICRIGFDMVIGGYQNIRLILILFITDHLFQLLFGAVQLFGVGQIAAGAVHIKDQSVQRQ